MKFQISQVPWHILKYLFQSTHSLGSNTVGNQTHVLSVLYYMYSMYVAIYEHVYLDNLV